MTQNLQQSVLTILGSSNRVVGAGFVLSDRLAVTCAHVLHQARSDKDGKVSIRFFHSNDVEPEVQVLTEGWSPEKSDDVAFLQLKGLPEGVVPVVLGSAKNCIGHQFSALGFPKRANRSATFAHDRLGGVVPIEGQHGRRPILQFEGRKIDEGMSGAPVLDLQTDRVVGMVCEVIDEKKESYAYATTADTLATLSSQLHLHPIQPIKEYLDAVRDYLTLHDIQSLNPLDAPYIPLRLQRRQAAIEQVITNEDRAKSEPLRSGPLLISEILRDTSGSNLLIFGEPGTGKSALLRYLAEHAWETPEQIGLSAPHLPILVPLRRLALTEGSFEKRLNDALANEISLPRDLPSGFFDEWPSQDGTDTRWLILLDAFDQVPDDRLALFMPWLKTQLQNIGQHRLVIATRPFNQLDRELGRGRFIQYDLLHFTPEQTSEFAHKWFADKAGSFLKELKRLNIVDLSGTPLLLTIAAKVYSGQNTLPERRSALYEQFVDGWLREAQSMDPAHELDERTWKVVRFALEHLALVISEQSAQITEAVLIQASASYLCEALRLSEDEAQIDGAKFVRVMARRSGFFVQRRGIYEFIHDTFREYLAASALVRDCKADLECTWRTAISRWREGDWYTVALFALGILSDAGQDVTVLINRAKHHFFGFLLDIDGLRFAGMALGDRVKIDPQAANQLIDDLLRETRDSDWVDHGIRIVHVLGRLGQWPKTIDGLRALAADKKVKDLVQSEAAATLCKLGYVEDAAPILFALARDVDFLTRSFAVDTLVAYKRVDELMALVREENLKNLLVYQRAASTLASLGRIDDLIALLHNETRDFILQIEVATSVAAVLAKLDKHDDLLLLARDEKIDSMAREPFIDALEQLGRTKELESFLFDEQLRASLQVHAAKALSAALVRLGHYENLLALARNKKLGDWGICDHFVDGLAALKRTDNLLELAQSETISAEVRVKAATQLGQLGRIDKATSIMLAFVNDNKAVNVLQVEVERALEGLGYLVRTDELMALARDESLQIRWRQYAVKALALAKKPDKLFELTQEEDLPAIVQVQAAIMLGNLGVALESSQHTDQAVRILSTLAHDQTVDEWARFNAANWLAKRGRTNETAPIILMVAHSSAIDPPDRMTVAQELYKLGLTNEAVCVLQEVAHNEQIEPKFRNKAAVTLGELGEIDKAESVVLALARDERIDAYDRLNAVTTLGELGQVDEAASALVSIIQNNRSVLMAFCPSFTAVGRYGDTHVLTELEQIVQASSDKYGVAKLQEAIDEIRKRIGTC